MTPMKKLILVIDDDRDLCELLDEYLTREGFRVEAAYDGETGLARVLSGSYGIIVLDVMLPASRTASTCSSGSAPIPTRRS